MNEQVKAIQKELGEEDERGELDALENKIKEAGMSKEAEEKCLSELKKLKMMPPMSAESTVVRNYIDTLLELPWKKKSRVSKDIAKADLILNADHYGLEKVKERILEYLAVQKRMDKLKGPILCLVGPPGWVKLPWVSRLPKRQAANMCVWRWAACVMKAKSAATAVPISALCRAKSCKTWRKQV